MKLHPRFSLLAAAAALAVLAGCNKEPRSIDYFAAHEADARAVVAACTAGTQTGGECDNAKTAVTDAARKKQMDDLIEQAKAHGG